MDSARHHHSTRVRYLTAGVIVCAGLVTASAATAAAPGPGSHSVPPATRSGTPTNATSVRTIHFVAHETQNKFLNEGGLGDEEIFRGSWTTAPAPPRSGSSRACSARQLQ
jgi:hypothetical protein